MRGMERLLYVLCGCLWLFGAVHGQTVCSPASTRSPTAVEDATKALCGTALPPPLEKNSPRPARKLLGVKKCFRVTNTSGQTVYVAFLAQYTVKKKKYWVTRGWWPIATNKYQDFCGHTSKNFYIYIWSRKGSFTSQYTLNFGKDYVACASSENFLILAGHPCNGKNQWKAKYELVTSGKYTSVLLPRRLGSTHGTATPASDDTDDAVDEVVVTDRELDWEDMEDAVWIDAEHLKDAVALPAA